MSNLILVTVANSLDDLLKEVTRKFFGESFASLYVGMQISANAHFHYEADVIFRFERVVKLNDVFVLQLA